MSPEEAAAFKERYLANKEKMDKAFRAGEGTELRANLDARRFNHLIKPPPLRSIYTLLGEPICTPGNIAAIAAHLKSGKSSVVGAMMASAMIAAGDDEFRDCLGFWSENPKGLGLLHFDTEQSPDDHWRLVDKAIKRAGLSEPPPWLCSYHLAGMDANACRTSIGKTIDWAFNAFGGIHSILIDGVADLVCNVNDPEECNPFVAELHDTAITLDCPIIGVIHLNPGSEKTRGHLGSQLERKAETNLLLDKDATEVTTIYSAKQRRAPIPKAKGPAFHFSRSVGMHVRIENPSIGKAQEKMKAKTSEARQQAEELFVQAGKKELNWSEVLALLMERHKIKKDGAKKRLKQMLEVTKVLKKNAADFYELA